LTISRIFQGDYIWIEPISGREFDVAIGAKVVSAEGNRIQVRDDDGRVRGCFVYVLSRGALGIWGRPDRCVGQFEPNPYSFNFSIFNKHSRSVVRIGCAWGTRTILRAILNRFDYPFRSKRWGNKRRLWRNIAAIFTCPWYVSCLVYNFVRVSCLTLRDYHSPARFTRSCLSTRGYCRYVFLPFPTERNKFVTVTSADEGGYY